MINKSNPRIAVIGLGVFGMSLVKTLAEDGADVIAVDNNMDHLDEVKGVVEHTICFDATDAEELKSHGLTDVDIAVIAIGEHFEPVVLISMELVKAGVGRVYARTNSETQQQILEKIGVTEVIHPERQVAERMGISLHRPGMKDLLELGDDLSVLEIETPDSMIGQTLSSLNLRKRYGINILTIKRLQSDTSGDSEENEYHSIGIPNADSKIQTGDRLVLMGHKEDCEKIVALD
ncbi:MAG TPA: TrkA family potassium uptake protein [Balneolaceae bacterium]|nr:TrkA family potassium uptake protein [Balneolaceae bacterium]